MRNARAIVERHPLISFFVLAYVLTWPMIPLVSVSPLLGLPALFGTALAAIIVASLAEGKSGLKDLLSRLVRWRVGARWYAVALGLPAGLALTAAGVHSVLISTLLHGAINLSQGIFLGGVDPGREYWLLVAVYGVAALAVALIFGPNLARRQVSMQANITATAGPPAQNRS